MIYLIDTNAYDNFYKCQKGSDKNKYAKNVNVQGLKELLTDKNANVRLHSATMYELLVRCYKNNKIQEKYKKKGQINLSQFSNDYQFIIKENGFHIMNERPYYFEWEKLVGYYNDGKPLDIYSMINKKIEMEHRFIFDYLTYMNMICCYKWFDDYKEKTGTDYINDEGFYKLFKTGIDKKINLELKRILAKYYYENYDNNFVTKRIDSILNYYLTKHLEVIEKQLDVSNVGDSNEKYIKLLAYLHQMDNEKIMNGNGAEFAKNALKNKQLENYLTEAVLPILNHMQKQKTENKYLKFLITNTFKQGSKLTKNDASDYYILSVGDLLPSENKEKLVVITYDKKMKKFLEENNIYYDKDIYDKIYYNK